MDFIPHLCYTFPYRTSRKYVLIHYFDSLFMKLFFRTACIRDYHISIRIACFGGIPWSFEIPQIIKKVSSSVLIIQISILSKIRSYL